MLGRMWNFLKRHKKKFVFTGAVIGGIVVLGKYAKAKLQELQEKETSECLAHARRQHHFDSNQRTCNMTVLSMIPTLRSAVMSLLDSETLTAQLKDKPANKLEIWDTLKITSFSRTVVAVYSCCILIVFLRVQLNIIGGYMYLDTLATKNGMLTQQAVRATSQVQQKYLALVQYIMEDGLADLTSIVQAAVKDRIDDISLKQHMSLLDIQDTINSVRNRVERSGDFEGTGTSLCRFMLAGNTAPDQASSLTAQEITIQQLTNETKDMLESDDFHLVMTVCLDMGFSRLVDKLAEYFKPVPDAATAADNPGLIAMPVAKIIPIMNGLINVVLGDPPNQFVQELLLKDQVKDFAANVYEAFSQPAEMQTPA